jgi:hypothetical protein
VRALRRQGRHQNPKRSIEALEEAATRGFRAWERVEQPLLAKARRDPRYPSILDKMKN